MKTKVETSVRINAYTVIERAVEEGIEYGYHRAFKYDDNPPKDHIMSEIEQAVMTALCEVLDFGDTE